MLASYLDAHFREARSAVRAQVESELADATYQDDSEQTARVRWQSSTSRVSIAPELEEPALPNDSLGGSTVPVPLDAPAPPTVAEVDGGPLLGGHAEPDSRGLIIGGLLGFLACAVALLAWSRFAPEPAPGSPQPAASTTKPSAGARAAGEPKALRRDGPPPAVASATPIAAPEAPPPPSVKQPSPALPIKPERSTGLARRGRFESATAENVTPAAPVEPAAASPSCEIPFELTPDGFKRFKPECLPRSP
jgi:hypothetical protein